MTDMNVFWQLTSKYLNREITEQEKITLFNMLESDPLLRDEFEEAKKIWQQSEDHEPGNNSNLLQRTHQKIREYEAGEREAPELPPYEYAEETPVYTLPAQRRNGWKKWIAAAAVITGVGLFSYWLFQSDRTIHRPVRWVTVDVAPGQQQKIVLADNSLIYVNAGSHVEYPLSFTDSIREIRLSGEAFFEVTKNAHQPFIVQTSGLRTRVLGTSFNVRAYTGEATQSVLVATGKVQVSAEERSLDTLLPNRLLIYNRHERNYTVTDQSPATMDWQQNRMAFNDISFKDLAAELGRRYGKNFVFTNPALQNCHYRVIFNDLPLEKILQQLSLINGFRYSIKGDSIYLEGKGCE